MIARMATGAVAVAITLGAPSLATADWTDGTNKVLSNANVTLAGNSAFVGSLGGINCTEAFATGVLIPGTTGQITSFGASNLTAQCHTSGLLAGCDVHSLVDTGVPWTIHTDGSVVSVTTILIDTTLSGAFCPYHELTLNGDFGAVSNNLHSAGNVTFYGSLPIRNGTSGAFIQWVQMSGTMSITPSGTYGIT